MSAFTFQTFDRAAFLRDYWQKRPLLIRNPWTQWRNPLEPDELAGLACEPFIESRLVSERAGQRMLEHGPLAEDRFATLGADPWTLLVQSVDHHVADVAALLDPFRFIPNWRVDDVMVSYAVNGGGVGPHFDHYDVFLIQGLGQRRWRIGGRCDEQTPLEPHDDLRLLAEFSPSEEWVLSPGDMLYVPPGIAHDGVAVGDDCMTYSIGFRAPSRADLIADWSEDLLDRLEEDDRYTDPALRMQDNPGEITADALDRLQAMMAQALLDKPGFANWFGRFNTSPKPSDIDWKPEQPVDAAMVRRLVTEHGTLLRNPASRFAFIEGDADMVTLFVDGESIVCAGDSASLARQLCAHSAVALSPGSHGSAPCVALIQQLLNAGCLALDEES